MAQILKVTTLSDTSTPGDGFLSLREAIELGNADPGETKISFAGSLRGGTIHLQDFLDVTGGNITIDGDINNDGFNDITISGDSNNNGVGDNGDTRLLVVRDTGTIKMDYINFADSYFDNATEPGTRAAAIANFGTLTITNGVISGNTTESGNAATVGANGDVGTVFNSGAATLTVRNTLFSDNDADAGTGGGFAAVSGILNRGTLVADKVGFDGTAAGGGGGSVVGIKNEGTLSNDGNPILIGLGAGGTGVVGGAADPIETGQSGSVLDDLNLDIDGVTDTVALGFANDDLIVVRGGTSTVIGGHGEDILDVRPNVDFVTFLAGKGADQVDLSLSQLVGATIDLRITTVQAVTADFDVLLQGVEDLRGTPTDDILIGNVQGNKIAGQGATDTIYGYGGQDRLFASEGGTELAPVVMHGGGGADLLNFRVGVGVLDGAGMGTTADKHRDTFSFADSFNGGTIDLRRTDAQELNIETTITFSNIENVVGSILDDDVTGTAGRNRLSGSEGNDELKGLGGRDELFGGDGADMVLGGGGIDQLVGGLGNDELRGGGGNDTASGGNGRDDVFGGNGNDILRGDGGNDKVYGQAGGDTLRGDGGNDQIFGGGGGDKAQGDAGADVLRLGGGNDDGEGGLGNDRLFGGFGNDKLFGGAGIDRLFGNAGSDTLNGGNGKDRLEGGGGNDFLIGGAGPDTFVLLGASGDDLIRDFVIGVDKIDLASSFKFSDLTLSQQGQDALVEFGANSVRLEGIDKDDLSGSDFLF